MGTGAGSARALAVAFAVSLLACSGAVAVARAQDTERIEGIGPRLAWFALLPLSPCLRHAQITHCLAPPPASRRAPVVASGSAAAATIGIGSVEPYEAAALATRAGGRRSAVGSAPGSGGPTLSFA